jgi:hypothetical protein
MIPSYTLLYQHLSFSFHYYDLLVLNHQDGVLCNHDGIYRHFPWDNDCRLVNIGKVYGVSSYGGKPDWGSNTTTIIIGLLSPLHGLGCRGTAASVYILTVGDTGQDKKRTCDWLMAHPQLLMSTRSCQVGLWGAAFVGQAACKRKENLCTDRDTKAQQTTNNHSLSFL